MVTVTLALLGLLWRLADGIGPRTDAPIIGVLTVPVGESGCVTSVGAAAGGGIQGSGGSCFHSIYVKWIESAGGRVVPLPYDLPDAEMDATFDSLNGVLFTVHGHLHTSGGEINITDLASPYVRTASRLLQRALAANAAGQHVPVWGTCQGFQLLSVLVAREPAVLRHGFDSESLQLPLELLPGALRDSRLLAALPGEVVRWLVDQNITVNLHHDGVEPEAFSQNRRLRGFFRVLSTNRDRRGRPFVSTIEGRDAPVYAVQWHPERPQFQFGEQADESGIDHGPHAIRAMQAVANFFVDEARLNGRHFDSHQDEADHLIYNYEPQGRDAYQVYVFPPASAWRRPGVAGRATWV